MKHLVWRNVIAFIVNAYNDVEGLEERRMSLLTYGLLEQTTTQRKCQPGGQNVRRENDIRETLHGKTQT